MDGQRSFALKALSAVMMGAMLGILTGIPHEELLGFSVPLYSVLRSLVSTVTFVGLATSWPIVVHVRRREGPRADDGCWQT
jgi:hypothetical protein